MPAWSTNFLEKFITFCWKKVMVKSHTGKCLWVKSWVKLLAAFSASFQIGALVMDAPTTFIARSPCTGVVRIGCVPILESAFNTIPFVVQICGLHLCRLDFFWWGQCAGCRRRRLVGTGCRRRRLVGTGCRRRLVGHSRRFSIKCGAGNWTEPVTHYDSRPGSVVAG